MGYLLTPLKWLFRAALVALVCFAAPPLLAQTTPSNAAQFVLPVTEGTGPAEHVVDFVIAPGAIEHRLDTAGVGRLGQAMIGRDTEAQRSAELNLAIQVFGDTQGSFGALGTLAEHALWLDQFGDVNNALNNIGLVLALAQVARDGWNGDDRAALTGGIKAWMNFIVGRFGTGAMQIGSVATFVVDVTLREWQSGLTEIANDVRVCRYMAWYQEHPVSIQEWTEKAWDRYLESEQGHRRSYATYIDGMLNEYVHRAFLDGELNSYGDCGTSVMGERAYIEAKIEAEHKRALEVKFAYQVMPVIGQRAWERTLNGQVRYAKDTLMPGLNRTMTLEVTGYGYPGGTRVVLPLPAGGEWAGKLRDDGTFRAKITRYAIQQAGFPETIRLDGPNGPEERKLMLTGDRLTAMFGTPETPMVSRYRLTEGAGDCTVKRIHSDGTVTQEQVPDGAPHATEVDVALLPTGAWVLGHYAPGTGWAVASPGIASGNAIHLGWPHVDRISALTDCDLRMLVGDKLSAGTCRISRYDEKRVSPRTMMQRHCTAPAALELTGFFASVVTGEMTWYPMDGPVGAMLAETMKLGLDKGVTGAAPDLSAIPGMPAVPPSPE